MRLTVLLILFAPVLLSQSSDHTELASKMAEHRYQEVIDDLEHQSLDVQKSLILAKAYRQLGRSKDALILLEKARYSDSTDSRIVLALGEIYYSRSQYQQAYQYLKLLCEIKPFDPYYQKLAGNCAAKDFSLKPFAIAHYQKAHQLSPSDRDAASALAIQYFELGQNISARSLTQEFVSRDSTDLGMLKLDTRIAYLMELYDEVVSNVNYMLAHGDTVLSSVRLAAVSHYHEKHYDKAQFWLNYVAVLAPSEQVYFYLGMTNYRLENYREAIVNYEKAIEESRSPSMGNFKSQLAITLDKAGSNERALETYQEAYSLTENHHLLFRMAVICDDELRNYKLAKSYYLKYLQECPSINSTERLYAEDRLSDIKRAEFLNVED